MNPGMHIYFQMRVFLFLDNMAALFLIFWGLSILFSIVAAAIYISTNSAGDSLFSTFLPTFVISYLLDKSQSDRHKVISHCDFDVHFPDDWWYWASFPVSVVHQYAFLGKMPIQILREKILWKIWIGGFC